MIITSSHFQPCNVSFKLAHWRRSENYIFKIDICFDLNVHVQVILKPFKEKGLKREMMSAPFLYRSEALN